MGTTLNLVIKTVFILILKIIIIQVNLNAQYSNAPPFNKPEIAACIEKYWHYRDRLKYFIVPGPSDGQSMVAGIRNLIGRNKNQWSAYGQQAVYQGYYIGVLATEYKLLSDNNSDGTNNILINQTLKELYYALYAYIWQMDANEQFCYNKGSSQFDGFFIRSRIPDDFLQENNNGLLLNNFHELTEQNSSWIPNVGFGDPDNHTEYLPFGKPGHINRITPTFGNGCEPMSQDEIIGLLTGLSLLVKYIPAGHLQIIGIENGPYGTGLPPNGDFNLRLAAQDIIYRIVRYIGSGGYYHQGQIARGWCENHLQMPWTQWRIYDPDCNYIGDAHGGNVLFFSHGIASTANQWSFQANYNDGWIGLWDGWVYSAIFSNNTIVDWMGCTLAALGNLLPYNILYSISHKYNWDTFYCLLWADLYDIQIPESLPSAFNMMTTAPCEGPYRYPDIIFNEGWCTEYRWHMSLTEQEFGQDIWFHGNYTGLDYMLLLNLSLIQINKNTCNLSGNVPFLNESSSIIIGDNNNEYNVFCDNSIISNQVFQNSNNSINQNPANGTYISKTAIILKDGFKVENGARFHAVVVGPSPYSDMQSGVSCDYLNTNLSNKTLSYNVSIQDSSYKKKSKTSLFSFFPNPTNGVYNVINSDNNCLYSTDIYNVLGKNIITAKTGFGYQQFDLSLQPEGIYFVRLCTCDGNTITEKVILKK